MATEFWEATSPLTQRERERAAAETAAPRRWAEERMRMWAVLTPHWERERGEAKSGLLSTKASSQQGL